MPKYQRTEEADTDDKSYSEEFNEEQAQNASQEGGEGEGSEPNLDPEEKTYKKRYGDLRRYQQQQEQEKDQRIRQLEGQLSDAAKKQIKFPKTDEEIDEWASKYPDVAAIIDTIAQKRVERGN